MKKPGKTYHPSGSKTGRRIMAAAVSALAVFNPRSQSRETADWNAAVEAKKQLKKDKRHGNT